MKNEINVILSYGYGGKKWSGGMDLLRHKLAKLDGVDYTSVMEYGAWKALVEQLRSFRDPTVLIGHSYGATAMLGAARHSGVQIPLLVTVDPSQWIGFLIPASWSLLSAGGNVLPGNVFRGHNFYTQGGIIGNQKVPGSTNEYVPNVSHTEIDDYWEVHDKIIALVGQVIREQNV